MALTYEIPPELDEATKYILQEIGKMGREIRNGEGHEICSHRRRGLQNLLKKTE